MNRYSAEEEAAKLAIEGYNHPYTTKRQMTQIEQEVAALRRLTSENHEHVAQKNSGEQGRKEGVRT